MAASSVEAMQSIDELFDKIAVGHSSVLLNILFKLVYW